MTSRLVLLVAALMLFGCSQHSAKKDETPQSAATTAQRSDPDTIANEKVVRAFADDFNSGNLDAAAALYADRGTNHGTEVTRAEIRTILGDIHTRFPDAHFNIMMMVSQGEWVVTRAMYGGTHQGVGQFPIDGGLLVGVHPTGKTFEVQTIHMFRIRNGQIIEHWANRDDLGMMQQLGLLPEQPPANWLGATPPAVNVSTPPGAATSQQ